MLLVWWDRTYLPRKKDSRLVAETLNLPVALGEEIEAHILQRAARCLSAREEVGIKLPPATCCSGTGVDVRAARRTRRRVSLTALTRKSRTGGGVRSESDALGRSDRRREEENASKEEEPLLREGAATLGTPGCSPSRLAGYSYPLVELLV